MQRAPDAPPAGGPHGSGSWRPSTVELAVMAAIALLISWQLFVQPVAGLANNGDFHRVMAPLGIEPDGPVEYFANVQPAYRVDLSRRAGVEYATSALLPVGLAALLGAPAGGFDVRLVGALYLALLLLATWLLLLGARKLPAAARAATVLLSAWIFTDLEYTGYFNSLYSEPTALLMLLLLLGFALGWKGARGGYAFPLAVLAAGGGLALAKRQDWVAGPLVAAVVVAALGRASAAGAGPRRVAVLGALALTLVAARSGLQPQNPTLRDCNLFNAVFFGVLKDSPAPEADLTDLGLPAALARFRGLNYWHPDNPSAQPAFRSAFYARVSTGSVVAFYLRHPLRLAGVLGAALRTAADMHPAGLGHFVPGARGAVDKERRFTAWSRSKAALGPAFPAVALGVLVLALLLPLAVHRRTPLHPVMLLPLLALSAFAQLGAAVVGDGMYELAKHLFFFHALLDACAVGLAAWALTAWAGRRRAGASDVLLHGAPARGAQAQRRREQERQLEGHVHDERMPLEVHPVRGPRERNPRQQGGGERRQGERRFGVRAQARSEPA